MLNQPVPVSGVVGGSGVVVDLTAFSLGADVVVLKFGLGFGRDFNAVFVSFSWLYSFLESLKYIQIGSEHVFFFL